MPNLFRHLYMSKDYYVYIVGNDRPTLYVGVASGLVKRVYQHRHKLIAGFTAKYSLNKPLYFEVFNNPNEAIKREKQLKNWHREWKLNLIKSSNSKLDDLFGKIVK